jgi:membrane associated rhomboid family serine protease
MRFIRKLQYNSPVVLTFAFISLAVLCLGKLSNGTTDRLLFSVYRSPLTDPLTYLRLFLHVLGHSSYMHYINNMLLLLVVGPPLEEKYGPKALLWSILAAAAASGAAQWAFFPGTAALGASGVVFMMIVLSSFAGMTADRIPLTLLFVILFYLGKEVLDGLFTSDNISQLSHIIGGVCGAVIGFLLSRRSADTLNP